MCSMYTWCHNNDVIFIKISIYVFSSIMHKTYMLDFFHNLKINTIYRFVTFMGRPSLITLYGTARAKLGRGAGGDRSQAKLGRLSRCPRKKDHITTNFQPMISSINAGPILENNYRYAHIHGQRERSRAASLYCLHGVWWLCWLGFCV